MGKYFTKYLPVEGKIRLGDWYIWHNNKQICQAEADLDVLNTHLEAKHVSKLRLFLCSRDIRIGDKYLTAPDYSKERICEDPKNYSFEHCLKVIGEISPNAIWVKEGDEFDEDVLYFKPIPRHSYIGFIGDDLVEESIPSEFIIQIKCPTCKQYH